MSNGFNPYQKITEHILESINSEEKKVPWVKPWRELGRPRNGITNREYQGFNALSLMAAPHTHAQYFTFRQVKDQGGYVKRGSKGYPILCWFEDNRRLKGQKWQGPSTNLSNSKTENSLDPPIPLRKRVVTVFNIEQTEGLERAYDWKPIEGGYEKAEALIQASGAEIFNARNAYYQPGKDQIFRPAKEAYPVGGLDEYYSTTLHEMAHWTGHQSRLARAAGHPFGSPEYAREELVAELASAFQCSRLGINSSLSHSGTYLEHWLKGAKENPSYLFTAAKEAEKATEYIFSLAPQLRLGKNEQQPKMVR